MNFRYIAIALVFATTSLHPIQSASHVPAKTVKKQVQQEQYISATIAISSVGFVSLENAYKEIAQHNLKKMGLTASPVMLSKYHMTLAGFNIKVASYMTQHQKNDVKKTLANALTEAAHDAIKKTLVHLKKKHGHHESVVLPFCSINIFTKWIIAMFESTKVFTVLQNTMEKYFKNNVKHLVQDGTITAIIPHQTVIQPHVALAKITDPSFAGTSLIPQTSVTNFHISKPEAIISVQWRS